MGQTTSTTEPFLEVGKRAVFHMSPDKAGGVRMPTVIRGWQKGSHIVLEMCEPKQIIAVRKDEPCVLRYMAEGSVWGFTTKVADIGTGSFGACVRVRWPTTATSVRVRKHERVQANVSCTIKSGLCPDVVGELCDISFGGCRVHSPRSFAEKTPLTLSFTLPDGAVIEDAEVTVMNLKMTMEGAFIGCRIDSMDEGPKRDVQFYVQTTLERMRGELPNAPRVLIIGPPREGLDVLRDAIVAKQFEVTQERDIVDGLFRLRMTMPVALLIDASVDAVDPLEVCKVIRTKQRYEAMPIVLYGREIAADELEQAGVMKSVADLSDADTLVALVEQAVPEREHAAPAPNEEPAGKPENVPGELSPETEDAGPEASDPAPQTA